MKKVKRALPNYVILSVALVSVFLLAACSISGQEKTSSPNTLIYANLSGSSLDREAINEFNRTHEDVQIEVRDYLDENGTGPKTKLLMEIATGKGPDIIDMGRTSDASTTSLPYKRMVQAGYLEDLWPYIDRDPELGRGAVLGPPLKAAEIDGGLYLAFSHVRINTLVGAESIVGDRKSWTLGELREAFASMPEGSEVLDFGREEAFIYISCMCLDSYVDWETGQCYFDSESFRALLEFVNSFPAKSALDGIDPTNYDALMEVNREKSRRLYDGRQMLVQSTIGRLQEIQLFDSMFGGTASFVGYPVEDGSVGSCFYIYGNRLAMSSTCRDKEAAWDFLRQMFLPKGSGEDSIPINRSEYERSKKCDVSETVSYSFGPEHVIHAATEEERQRYEDLVNSINKIELCDKAVFDIVKETASPYFAGDRSLDDTVDLIQRRVTLYVNEQR